MDNPFKSPAVLSFCPGFLGIERGLKRAGVDARVMAYIEIEAVIIANLLAGMETNILDPAPIWTDAETFDASPFRGRVHGIVGGYPCPGESLAGLREKHLYEGFIWPSIRRAIAAARPIWCFFENVDDHLTGTYPIVYRSLRNMGYVVEAGVFSAEEVGAPHERQRLFILAVDYAYCNEHSEIRKYIAEMFGVSKGEQAELGASLSFGASRKMDNSNGHGFKQEHEIRTRRNSIEHASQELANTFQSRLEGQRNGAICEQSKLTLPTGYDFPMGQGFEQYEWEEPRTLEPILDIAINGYNFRSDLLRAAGNMVVEQTAELAFRTLLKKHEINL